MSIERQPSNLVVPVTVTAILVTLTLSVEMLFALQIAEEDPWADRVFPDYNGAPIRRAVQITGRISLD